MFLLEDGGGTIVSVFTFVLFCLNLSMPQFIATGVMLNLLIDVKMPSDVGILTLSVHDINSKIIILQ